MNQDSKAMFDLLEGLGGDEHEHKTTTRELVQKAPFAYPGGKSRSIPHLRKYIPITGRYVEVFGGSGVHMLNRPASKFEVYNDRHGGLIDFYRCVQNPAKLESLIAYLDGMLWSREWFLDCRDTWSTSTDQIERAAKWFYSVQMSFGSQGRNFGRDLKKTGNKLYGTFSVMQKIHPRLKNVLIENLDWRDCLTDFDHPETIFYLDPPYMVETTSGHMYEHQMTRSNHIELCDRVFNTKGFVAISGYENEIYSQYPWDQVEMWEVFISMTGMSFTESNNLIGMQDQIKRGNRMERLYIKYAR
jgi:DNA adenine methylase